MLPPRLSLQPVINFFCELRTHMVPDTVSLLDTSTALNYHLKHSKREIRGNVFVSPYRRHTFCLRPNFLDTKRIRLCGQCVLGSGHKMKTHLQTHGAFNCPSSAVQHICSMIMAELRWRDDKSQHTCNGSLATAWWLTLSSQQGLRNRDLKKHWAQLCPELIVTTICNNEKL